LAVRGSSRRKVCTVSPVFTPESINPHLRRKSLGSFNRQASLIELEPVCPCRWVGITAIGHRPHPPPCQKCSRAEAAETVIPIKFCSERELRGENLWAEARVSAQPIIARGALGIVGSCTVAVEGRSLMNIESLGLSHMISHLGKRTSVDLTAKGDADTATVRLAIKTVAKVNRMVSLCNER
jgi:hypothetical protein